MCAVKKSTAGRRTAKSAALSLPIDVGAARTFANAYLPGVKVTEKFGNASFSIGGKVFAFTRPDGLVLKLAAAELADVLTTREAHPLVMGTRVMREWAVLTFTSRDGYVDELPLLKAAMDFVCAPKEG